jgi:hypothetical protein
MSAWLTEIGNHPLFPAASVLVATLIGGLITWFAAWWYYKRSGDDLRNEADSLHKATSLVLSYLENQHAKVTVQRDSRGRVVGLNVGVSASARFGISGSGTLTDGSTSSKG